MITLFDSAHILAYTVAFMLIGTFIMLFHMALIYYREQDASREGMMKNVQLAAIMRTCNIHIAASSPAPPPSRQGSRPSAL